jgi:hypothetical protein
LKLDTQVHLINVNFVTFSYVLSKIGGFNGAIFTLFTLVMWFFKRRFMKNLAEDLKGNNGGKIEEV